MTGPQSHRRHRRWAKPETIALMALCWALAACDSSAVNQVANDVGAMTDQIGRRNVHDWLATGSPSVCADPEIRASLSALLKPGTDLPFGEGSSQLSTEELTGLVDELQFDYKLTQLKGFEQDVAAVTCDANIVMRIRDRTWSPIHIRYRIAPSSDNPAAFILNADAGDLPMMARLLVGTVVVGIVNQRAPAQDQQVNASSDVAEPPLVDSDVNTM